MKLTVKIGELLEAVTQVAATLDRKGSVSGKMYFKAVKTADKQSLYLYATNLVAETLTKIEAQVEEGGEVLVEPGKLQDGLNGLGKDQEVTLALTPSKGALKAQCGKTKFSVAISAATDEISGRIKQLPLTEKPKTTIPAASISEFVKRGVFCIASDETGQNTNLTGLKFSEEGNSIEARATDSAIAVSIAIPGKKGIGKGFVIPHQSLGALSSLVNRKRGEEAEIILSPTGNKAMFKFGDTVYATLVLAAAFPNLTPIMNGNTGLYNFEVNREDLKATLHRASCFLGSKRIVDLELNDQELLIKTKTDTGNDYNDSVEVEFTEDGPTTPVKMSVGIDYLLNVAGSTRSNTLNIGITDKLKPLIITDSEGEGADTVSAKYVLMGVSSGK